MKKNRRLLKIFSVLFTASAILLGCFFLGQSSTFSPSSIPAGILSSAEAIHVDGTVFTINSSEDKFLSKMSRKVCVGDKIITNEGKIFKVSKVKNRQAVAEFQGVDEDFIAWQQNTPGAAVPVAKRENKSNKVAIYHTHSGESYVPTDGKQSQPGKGGIFKVGEKMASTLKEQGVNVIHDKSKHEPRDKNSYVRSRRTATQLLKENPTSIIDVHRDGVPDANYYTKNIDGEKVAQLRLVIGRQNPNKEANKDFAKKVMAQVNKKYPHLIKEIFVGKGNYNQDLEPTALLVEVGTHTSSREDAEEGISLFARALPDVLGIGKAGAARGSFGDPNAKTPGGWMSIVLILAVVVLGGGAFLIISSGGISNARDRLNKYLSREMVNLLMPRRKNKK